MYKLENDTWKDFEETVEGRKLFLYGDANIGKEFINSGQFEVTGYITNEFEKTGEEFEGVPIWSVEEFGNMEPQEVVVLITCINCEERIKEISEYGMHNYFVKSYLDKNALDIV